MKATAELSPASLDDLEAITSLEARSFPAPWRREYFESELRAAGRYNRVAKDTSGRLLGYLFAMYYLDEMHINKIAIEDIHRRKGLATWIMKDCIAFAKSKSIVLLSLEVRQSNVGAQEFYKTLDFAPAYVRRNYYPDGEAAVVMVAKLKKDEG